MDNKNIVLKAVKQNGLALEYASEELKNDKEIVLKAVKNKSWALKFSSKELKKIIKNSNPIEILQTLINEEILSNTFKQVKSTCRVSM